MRGAIGISSSPSAGAAPQLAVGMRDQRGAMADARRPLTVSRTWFCPPRQVRAVSMWRENIVDRLYTELQSSQNTDVILCFRVLVVFYVTS